MCVPLLDKATRPRRWRCGKKGREVYGKAPGRARKLTGPAPAGVWRSLSGWISSARPPACRTAGPPTRPRRTGCVRRRPCRSRTARAPGDGRPASRTFWPSVSVYWRCARPKSAMPAVTTRPRVLVHGQDPMAANAVQRTVQAELQLRLAALRRTCRATGRCRPSRPRRCVTTTPFSVRVQAGANFTCSVPSLRAIVCGVAIDRRNAAACASMRSPAGTADVKAGSIANFFASPHGPGLRSRATITSSSLMCAPITPSRTPAQAGASWS